MFTSKDKRRFAASKQKFLEVLKDRTEGVGELVAIENLKWCNVKLPYNSATRSEESRDGRHAEGVENRICREAPVRDR